MSIAPMHTAAEPPRPDRCFHCGSADRSAQPPLFAGDPEQAICGACLALWRPHRGKPRPEWRQAERLTDENTEGHG